MGGQPSTSGGTFEAPYAWDLWARDFEAWRREILPEILREANVSGGASGGGSRHGGSARRLGGGSAAGRKSKK